MNLLQRIKYCLDNSKLQYPDWLFPNIQYLTVVGSEAYGMASKNSDLDLAGFCIEPKRYIFPNFYGDIVGFDNVQQFNSYQQHHIQDPEKSRSYDLSIYGLVKIFHLMYDGNPNAVEILFTERQNVIHASPIAEKIRSRRDLFLSKRFCFKSRMYGYSQLQKLERQAEGKRQDIIDEYGWDTKYQSHVYRLILMAESVLINHKLDLQENAELLKYVREGNISPDESRKWFTEKEQRLAEIEKDSTLRQLPDREAIKSLLIECIETHYGNIFEQQPTIRDGIINESDIALLENLVRKLRS